MIIGGTSSGTVTSSPGGITCAGATVSCTGWFPEGTPVTLTATPDPGMVIVGWIGGVPTPTDPLVCEITVNGPKSVVAHFASPLQYYHLDVLGSVRMITNAAGAVVRRHDYFAFGEDIEAPTGDPRRFTGKERDAETELHYFGARYYRNVWGRFTSPDPGQASGSGADPQGWNAYAYARNNPFRYIDPNGTDYVIALDGYAEFSVSDSTFGRFRQDPNFRFIGGQIEYNSSLLGWMVVGTYAYYNPFDVMIAQAGRNAKPMATLATRFLEGIAIGVTVGAPLTGSAPCAQRWAVRRQTLRWPGCPSLRGPNFLKRPLG